MSVKYVRLSLTIILDYERKKNLKITEVPDPNDMDRTKITIRVV